MIYYQYLEATVSHVEKYYNTLTAEAVDYTHHFWYTGVEALHCIHFGIETK